METDIVTHVVLVTGIVQKGNKFLIARRSYDDPQAPGSWATPGGKVDIETGDDVILKTLKREIKEEVGVEIKNDIYLYQTDGFIRISGHHVVGLHFLCLYESGIAKPLEDQAEVRWMTMKELKASQKEFDPWFKKRIFRLDKFLIHSATLPSEK